MFHHAHVYLAGKLFDSEDPLLLLGSILPDLAVVAVIKWEDGLHGKDADNSFLKFVKDKYPSFLDLARGVHAHNIIDDFTHKDYVGGTGYAFQNNKQLARLIAKYYQLDKQGSIGKAHNFIESGVDISLLIMQPEIQNKLRDAISIVDREKLAEILSSYFNIDRDKFLKALSQFFDLFTKYDFTIKDNWFLFWTDLEKLLSLKDIGDQKRAELIDESINIARDTYKDFFEYSITKGQKMI